MLRRKFTVNGYEYVPTERIAKIDGCQKTRRLWHCFEQNDLYGSEWQSSALIPLDSTRQQVIATFDRAMFGPY